MSTLGTCQSRVHKVECLTEIEHHYNGKKKEEGRVVRRIQETLGSQDHVAAVEALSTVQRHCPL